MSNSIIVFGLQKGGVGKTTTCVSTGIALAQLGHKVLLIDGDPQGNLTTILLVNPESFKKTFYDFLMKKDVALSEVIIKTESGVDLVPANVELARAELEMVSGLEREKILARRFANNTATLEQYDYVLIDSPPSLGLLTVTQLVAADMVVMPVECAFLALGGLQDFLDLVSEVQVINPKLRLLGLLPTKLDTTKKASEEVETYLRETYAETVFKTRIQLYSELTRIPVNGPLALWRPKHPANVQYLEFAKELISRAKQN